MKYNFSNIIFIFCIFGFFLGVFFLLPYFQYVQFNSWYGQEKYADILEKYSEFENTSPEMLHNIGNTYFMQYKNSGEEKNLHKALEAYSGSLFIEEHEDTRYNYEYIKNLLLPEEGKSDTQEKNLQENQDNQNNTQGEESGSDNSSSFSQEKSGDNGQNPSGEDLESREEESLESSEENSKEFSQGESSQSIEENKSKEEETLLSENQKQQLENAVESLKNQQIYNQRYFGKQEQDTDFFGNFESFFGEVDRGGEKDW